MMHDVAADQFADHGTDQDVRREMIKTADSQQPYCRCESVGSDNDERFVMVLMRENARESERASGVPRREGLMVRQVLLASAAA